MKKVLLKMRGVVGLVFLSLITQQALAYTYDEVVQDFTSVFKSVGVHTSLSLLQKNPALGLGSGIDLPRTWETLSAGQDLRLKILVPPGVDFATIFIQAFSMDADIGTCEGTTTACTLQQANASPRLWPLVRAPGATADVPLATPKIVSLVVRAQSYSSFTMSSLTIKWHVQDVALYEAWRSARNWAGGSGDCDGLGGAYCNGESVPVPVPVSLTSISLTPPSITSGTNASSTIIPNTGATLPTCTSTNPELITIVGSLITGKSKVSQDTQVTIKCGSVETVLTLKAAAGSAATASCVSATENGINRTLEIKVGVTPEVGDRGKKATVWVAAYLPPDALIQSPEQFFLLNKNKVWTQLSSPIIADYAFEKGRLLEAAKENFVVIPTGASYSESNVLEASGVQLYLAYLVEGATEIKVLDPVWPSQVAVCP